MKITLNNTTHEIREHTTWPEILVAFIRMLRVEGYGFSDEDVIHNLDEDLETKVREEMYSDAYEDCLCSINNDLSYHGYQIERSSSGFIVKRTKGSSTYVDSAKPTVWSNSIYSERTEVGQKDTMVDNYGATRTYQSDGLSEQGHGGPIDVSYDDLEKPGFSYRD